MDFHVQFTAHFRITRGPEKTFIAFYVSSLHNKDRAFISLDGIPFMKISSAAFDINAGYTTTSFQSGEKMSVNWKPSKCELDFQIMKK